jgi:hypothetical protein
MPKADQVNSTDASESAPVQHHDDFLEENYRQQQCMAWHVHRAQQRLHWAQRDLNDFQGNDEGELDLSSLEHMKEIEEGLRDWEPKTPGGAVQLLEIAIEIYTHAQNEPDESFGRGPVFEYLRNLRRSIARFSEIEPSLGHTPDNPPAEIGRAA